MLGQQNMQYEWHPLMDKEYLNANGLQKYEIDQENQMMILEFDRSKSIRLDELLDSLDLLKLHAGQALYLMTQIIEQYLYLTKKNLEPKFIQAKNIHLTLEYGSDNLTIIFPFRLKCSIVFTYNSVKGTLQEVLQIIVDKFFKFQKGGDQKKLDSDRNILRNQLQIDLRELFKLPISQATIQELNNQIKNKMIYKNEQKLINLDSEQYTGWNRRQWRVDNFSKINQLISKTFDQKQQGCINSESIQRKQIYGLIIQKINIKARYCLLKEVKSKFFISSNIPQILDQKQINELFERFHYQSKHFDKFYSSYINTVQEQLDLAFRNISLTSFKMMQDSLKLQLSQKCQIYLRLRGYYNSSDEYEGSLIINMEIIEEELFKLHIVEEIQKKIREFIEYMFFQKVKTIDDETSGIKK